MANQLQTNGYSVFTNGSVLAFYAARYNNNVGNIIASETYNWQFAQDTQRWIVNGVVQNIYIQFGNNNSVRWYGYYEGGIGQPNSTFDISWDNVVTDDLTHHYYFHIARSGDGFANRSTVSLYIDGKFVSSKIVGSSLGHDAWFNIPIGIGAKTSGYGDRKIVTTGDGTYNRSYGEWQTPDIALGLIGQLWFGYGFATPSLGLDNLWRNGYVDLGPDGTNGAVTQIQPIFYNSFDYAGAGFTARTGLASNFLIQPGLTRVRTGQAPLVARSTVIARARNNSDYLARLQATSGLTAAGGFRRTDSSALAASTRLLADNIRVKAVDANLNTRFSITADLRKSGNSAEIESNFSITCSATIQAQGSSTLQAQATASTTAGRIARTSATILAQTQAIAQIQVRRQLQSNLQAFDSIQVQTQYSASALIALTARTSLTVNIADYKLTSTASLTVQPSVANQGRANLISQVTQQTQGNYNTTGSANLEAFASSIIIGQSRALTTQALIVRSETRRLLVHKETRQLEVSSETRVLDVAQI